MNSDGERTTRPKFSIILAAVTLMPLSVFGEIIVRQVDAAASTATAEVTAGENIQEKTSLFMNLGNGGQCVTEVLRVEGKHIVLETTKCEPNEVRKGATLELPLVNMAEVAPRPSKESPSENEQKVDESLSQGWRPSLLDLSYTPQANQFIAKFGVESSRSTLSLSQAGQSFNVSNVETSLLTTAFIYGISDNLTTVISMDTALSSNNDSTYGPASTVNAKKATYKSTGPSDPSIGLNFRIISQTNQQPFTAFVGVELKPAIVRAKTATEVTEGTRGAGGNRANISLSFFRESSRFGLGGQIGYLLQGNRSKQDATTDEVTVVSGGHQIAIAAQGLFKTSPFFAISGSITWYSVSAEESLSKTVQIETHGYSYVSPSVGIRGQLIPDRFLLMGAYSAVYAMSTRYKTGNTDLDATGSGGLYSASVVYSF